ncbi:MAG TPA: EamA family transporter [Planctomycetota bacterium]|nr:EamA family transporter [Planctomycetota bacterium]
MAYLFAILAGLCWGVGEVFTRAVLRTHEVTALAAIAIRTTVALPILWGVWAAARYGFAHEVHGPLERASTGTTWKLVLGSGVVAGAAGMAFFYLALGLADVSRVKPIAFGLAPATAVVLGWLLLGEALTVGKVAGLVLIVAGIVLITAR